MRFYFFAYVQFLKHDIKIHIEKHGSFAEKKQKNNKKTDKQNHKALKEISRLRTL